MMIDLSIVTRRRFLTAAFTAGLLLHAEGAVAEDLPRNGYVCVSAHVMAEEPSETAKTDQLRSFAISVFDAWARANGTARVYRPRSRPDRIVAFPAVECDRVGDLFVSIGLLSDDGRGSDFVRLTVSGAKDGYEATIGGPKALGNGPSAASILPAACVADATPCLVDDPNSGWIAATEDVIKRFTATLQIAAR